MNFFRKFYDIAPPAEAAPSLASVMAKSGVLRQPGEQGSPPSINTEKKEEPTPAPANAPATATATPKAEPAKPASSTPTPEPQPAQPQKEEPVKVPTWQEVLKSQQPSAILKELGLDERLADLRDLDPKIFGLLNHWKSKGDIKPYLRALDTDFQKMPPEEVMRHQLRMQNPELDDKQLDKLFKIKVIDRYKLDAQNYSEDEVDMGRIELMADVKPIRNTLMEEQKGYLLPTAPESQPAGPDIQEQQRQQEFEAYKSTIENSPFTRALFADKKLVIGEGDDKFSYAINPQELAEILYDNNKWAEGMFTKEQAPNGESRWVPDVEKQYLIAAVLKHGKSFLTDYANHHKSLGAKAAIAPIENAKPPSVGEPARAEVTDMNPAAAAAKRGRLVPGGYR